MTQQECTELLTQHGVKPTANRIVVLRALALAGRLLSFPRLTVR